MPSLPSIEEQDGYFFYRLGTWLGYITLSIGYLVTVLTTRHLTLPDFLVFTVLQVCYCVLLWWMIAYVWRDSPAWRIVPVVALLIVITEIVGLLPLIGLAWDWLLFLVTISVFFSILPSRVAIGAGILLYCLMVVDLFMIDNWNWSAVYPNLLSLLPAFAFVAVFSLAMRVQQEQRDRAERLLSQLEESNAELERTHKQLQAYAAEVEELTIVRERTRLAREIHDILGHHLSILNIQLETIGKLQERDPARAAIEIAEARRVAAQSMQEVRNAVAALRPTSIATMSLTGALAQLGKDFEHNAPDTTLTLDFETDLPPLPPDISLALYRAVQEALTNIRKHAQASKVLIRLRYEDQVIELLVLDNGQGTSQVDVQQGNGFGLIGLRERIELLGGQVTYGPAKQGGYHVLVRLPAPPAPQTLSLANQASADREILQAINEQGRKPFMV
ncbi:MAG TPA: sensor histidine kinase [Ktedonobacteraceae bacterium]